MGVARIIYETGSKAMYFQFNVQIERGDYYSVYMIDDGPEIGVLDLFNV